MDKFKLIYYEKYNQYYHPILIDEEKKVCRMVMTSNKKDKYITRDMIAHAEKFPDWKFIIMRNKHITAEENFVNAMRCEREYNRKLNELAEFKRNGLTDSTVAMGELLRIYQSGFGNLKSEKERHFRQRVKNLYIEICTEKAKNDRKATYDQTVPVDIMALAREYGLTVERNDEYVVRKGSRVKATKNEKEKFHAKEPCGFLVRDVTGKAIAGNGYDFTAAQAVEFIKKYTADMEGENLGKVMTEEVKKETPLEWFMRMVNSEDAKKRQIAVRYNAIKGIPEMETVKEVILEKALTDIDKVVRETAYLTVETMGWLDEEFQEAFSKAMEEMSEKEKQDAVIKKRDEALGFEKLPYLKCERKYESALDENSLLEIVAEKERVVIVMWHLKNVSKERFREQFKARFPRYKNMKNDEINNLYAHYSYLCENQREELKKEWDARNFRIKMQLPEELQLLVEECGLRVIRADGRGTNRKATQNQCRNNDCLSGYRLVDMNGRTVAGQKYELYEQDVYEFCLRYKEYLKLLSGEFAEDKPKKTQTCKFKVGQTWYMAQRGNPHQCVQVVILEIVDDKRVRVQRQSTNGNKDIYVCRADKLHKTPDKTMLSKKDKQKAVLDMTELNMKLKGEEFKVTHSNIKGLDKKVKELRQGYRLYMFKEGVYSITRKGQPHSKFISLKSEEEVLAWIAEKKKEDEQLRSKVADKKYIDFKGSGYYKIESIGFESRNIRCHYCEDIGKENISEETLIDPETLSKLKQSFRIIRNKRYEHLRKPGAEKEQKAS